MFYWVHTCPQRRDEVIRTAESLDRSDVPSYEVWEHPEAFTTSEEIEHWWEQRLLKAAKRGEFFVRLEDDVNVCRTLHNRLKDWGALHQSDFGLGVLYRWVGSPTDSWNVNRDKPFPRISDPYHMSAQGMVFCSALIPGLVEAMRGIRNRRGFRRIGNLNFDTVLGQACHEMSLSVYLHEPSLVDCRDVRSINQPGARAHTPARDFVEG